MILNKAHQFNVLHFLRPFQHCSGVRSLNSFQDGRVFSLYLWNREGQVSVLSIARGRNIDDTSTFYLKRITIFSSSLCRVNCSFYFKIGACRHGDRCSRLHNKPTFSQVNNILYSVTPCHKINSVRASSP